MLGSLLWSLLIGLSPAIRGGCAVLSLQLSLLRSVPAVGALRSYRDR